MKRFHNHNAYILPIKDENGFYFAEVFFSYDTPIGVSVGGKFITSKRWYSSSTTRQTNRYTKENNLPLDIMDNSAFYLIMRELASKHNFSMGLLR